MTATVRRLDAGRSPGRSLVWLQLAAVIALAVAVRFAGIGSRLSVDDAYSWFAASSPSAHVFLQRLADNENTPPLFYLLLMLMPSFAPAWLRVPAAIPGVLLCVTLYFTLRPRLGERAALLAALGVAVAPYLITYSNLARGFMLADLALLIAVWCVLSLGERETIGKWFALFVAGSVAVYSEYGSAIFIVALLAASLWIGVPRRRSMLVVCALVLLTLAAWIPQIVRGQNQVGLTKFDPLSATPSLSGLRDAFVTLALGEHGGTGSSVGRWLVFVFILGFCAVGYLIMVRGWSERDLSLRRTVGLLALVGVLTLLGYALAALVGVDVFTQRYLTILVPVGAALGAVVVTSADNRWILPVAAFCLIGLGFGNLARRLGGEWEPSLTPVAHAAAALLPRTVLTNTPVVLYYLPLFRPAFDRPYNLGPGRAKTCARPCLVIDDVRTHGGTPRPVAGTQRAIGPFVLTYVH